MRMNNYLGQKIRELRRMNDLTQEKLAEYLNISYQSVSKWETGTVTPDIAYIVPLARLFGVSTDELLGFDQSRENERKQELKESYEETWKNGDLTKRLEICRAAVHDYPGDMEWLCNLADALSMHSDCNDSKRYYPEWEEAVKYYETVIENAADEKLRERAVSGIVAMLSFLGRLEEAKKYVELYPEEKRDDIIGFCLKGEEWRIHKRKQTERAFGRFISSLNFYDPYQLELMGELIKLVIPDGNYITYSYYIYCHEMSRAEKAVRDNRFDDAMEYLRKAKAAAEEQDRIEYGAPGEYVFTAPLFEKVVKYTGNYFHTNNVPAADEMREALKDEIYEPLRERVDFKALFSRCDEIPVQF